MEEYTVTLSGIELDNSLRQLQALDDRPKGAVVIESLAGKLSITRKVSPKNWASVELKGSGHWPFPLHISWKRFMRLTLKAHAPAVKMKLLFDEKGEITFAVDGMHIPLEEIDAQFSLGLSNENPRTTSGNAFSDLPSGEKSLALNISTRIKEIDIENLKNGISTKELTYKVFERDRELSDLIKTARGEKCQICGHFFNMPNGKKYVECHHLEYLSNEGLDVSKNILVLCANHHRQFHYGNVEVSRHSPDAVEVLIDGVKSICSL